MFPCVFAEGIPRIAQEKGLVEVRLTDIRDFTDDARRTVDDRPFGGGPGMVMKPGPVCDAIEYVREQATVEGVTVLLSPQGETLTNNVARELAGKERLILVAGRYEGFDERIRTVTGAREISIGDYVLSGGELPAMVVVDAVVRLIPDVLGHELSAGEESFEEGLLDHPHYTRPREYRGHDVPDVLLSGDHEAIRRWRREEATKRTKQKRTDLLKEKDGRNGTGEAG